MDRVVVNADIDNRNIVYFYHYKSICQLAKKKWNVTYHIKSPYKNQFITDWFIFLADKRLFLNEHMSDWR